MSFMSEFYICMTLESDFRVNIKMSLDFGGLLRCSEYIMHMRKT